MIDWLDEDGKWAGLRSVAMVEATREIDGRVSLERRYYGTACPLTRNGSTRRCALTGPSKTACIGCSMSRLARINVVPGWTMQHKTSRSCAASCRIYCALTKPPRSASRTSGSRPDSMNTIGLECLECWSLDAIALTADGGEVDALVVPCSGLPAAVEDPYPLERQRPHGGLIRAALRSLLPVIGARPERFVDGLARPFNEGLAQECRALPAPVHPALLAAALGDRGDAGVLLQFISALV